MTKRAAALLAAIFCIAALSAQAGEFAVSPDDFGIDPAVRTPVVPAGEPTGDFLPYDARTAPQPVFAPLQTVPATTAISAVPNMAPVAPAPVADPLQTAAPDLYARLSATVTATTGDPSIPVVVRPATTAQATDASGAPVDIAGIAAQGSPVVDWNAARAGTPYPVETPGQPGVMTYVVPIQVPVYVQSGETGQPQEFAQPQFVQPVQPQTAQPMNAFVTPLPQAPLPVQFEQQPSQMQLPQAAQIAPPAQPRTYGIPAFAEGIVAVTPGVRPNVPTATAGIAGQSGVFYYGTNPVSIASALGMETATGTEFLDFGAMPGDAINLVTPAQIRQALLRQTPLTVIDVRGDLVRDIEGHIPGDIGIPFQPQESFADRVARAVPDKATPVVVYCHDGYWSSQAADVLLAMGYKVFLMGAYRLWM